MASNNISLYKSPSQDAALIAAIPQHFAYPGLTLAQITAIFWAYRKQSLAIALTILLISGIVLRLLPRTYEATAALIINYDVNDPQSGKEFPAGLLGSYISTQIELMQSPEVLLPVVDQLKLTGIKRYTSGYTGNGGSLREWAEAILAKNLVIVQGRFGSQLIYVNYSGPDPSEAALVANAVADVYCAQQLLRQTGPANDRARNYATLLDELKNKVTKAQEQVTEYRQKTGLLDSDERVDIDMEMLSALQQRLVEAQNARRTAEANNSQSASMTTSVMSSTLIQSLKTQLAEQESHMAELKATLGARHPQILELQKQLDSTRHSLAAETSSYGSGAASELAAARQLEQKMQQAVDEQHAKVLTTRSLHDEQAKYMAELESAQTVYKRALDGYDQIMVASNDHYSNVSFVSRAMRPLRASKPKVLKSLLMALLMGVALGVTGPLFYELLVKRRVRCRDDLERNHGIPVLAEFHLELPAGSAA